MQRSEPRRAGRVGRAARLRARRRRASWRSSGRSMVDPARFTRALRDWAGDGPRRAYAEEVAAVYRGYRAGLDARRPRRRRAVRLARARRPAGASRTAWGGTPLFVYGFDDFTALELDALETIAGRCGADVTRVAAVRARPRGLPGHRRHQAGAARPRRLRAGARAGRRALRGGLARRPPPPGAAPVRGARRAGRPGRRDLVPLRRRRARRGRARRRAHPRAAARGRRARATWPWCSGEPGRYASLLEQVFGAYGIPYSIDRSRAVRPHRHRARAAGADPLRLARRQRRRPARLPAHPRAAAACRPGRPARGRRAQGGRPQRRAGPRAVGGRALRARASSTGSRGRARRGRVRGRARGAPGTAVRRAARARGRRAERPGARRGARARAQGQAALGGAARRPAPRRRRRRPGRRRACPPRARAARGARGREPAARPRSGGHAGGDPRPPLRGRVRAAACRRASSRAARRRSRSCPTRTGARSRAPPGSCCPCARTRLDRERYLFYVCASRAERLLVLSSRSSDEEGNPQARVVLRRGRPRAARRRRRPRDALAVGRDLDPRRRRPPPPSGTARSPPPARAARSAWPGRSPAAALLAELAAREAVSAGALERFADCPVKWLVEDLLRPDALEPDPEAMVRGELRAQRPRADLRRASARRPASGGSPPPTSAAPSASCSRSCAGSALEFTISPKETRVKAAARRLEFDLLRYLRAEARSDSRFEPRAPGAALRLRQRATSRSRSPRACACAGASTGSTPTTGSRS